MSISSEIAAIPIIKKYIGSGDKAIYKTVDIMIDTIRRSSEDYYVRRWAEKLTNYDQTRQVGSNDIVKLQSLFNSLGKRVRYMKDILGLEMIKNPKIVLQMIESGEVPSLDCDCMTVLILALIRSLGFRVAIRVIATKADKRFSHVYGLVLAKDRLDKKFYWIPADLTRPDKGLGWEFPLAVRIYTKQVEG